MEVVVVPRQMCTISQTGISMLEASHLFQDAGALKFTSSAVVFGIQNLFFHFDRERDSLQVPHFFVGTLQPL